MRRTDREMPAWAFSWRTAHWWEWLVILLLLGLAAGARAAPVYKCVGADGSVAYQGIACAPSQRESPIELTPAPAYAKSPEYALERESAPSRHGAAVPRRASTSDAMSYECRSADGQVFYRHSTCPHSIAAADAQAVAHNGRKTGSGGSVPVSSLRIPRDDACRQIHAGGAIGRSGHQHDEDVSTYERNLGRDPCR